MINARAQRGNEYESLLCSWCQTWTTHQANLSQGDAYRCQGCGHYQRLPPNYSPLGPLPADKGGDADDGS